MQNRMDTPPPPSKIWHRRVCNPLFLLTLKNDFSLTSSILVVIVFKKHTLITKIFGGKNSAKKNSDTFRNVSENDLDSFKFMKK